MFDVVNKILMLILGMTLVIACEKNNDGRMTEKANIEGQANAEGQRIADAKKALEMEKDLAIRQRFYQSLSGVFNGTIRTTLNSGDVLELHVRFTFVPSLPPYISERTRAIDEIISDLNNLFFTVEVLHWDPQDSAIVFGCVFENVRPDLSKGMISLAKDGCPSLFTLHIFEDDSNSSIADLEMVSKKLAKDILSGQKLRVEEIKGFRQSTKTTGIFDLAIKR